MPETSPASTPLPGGPLERVLSTALRRAVASQSQVAVDYVDRLRRADPKASPADIITKLDRRFLSAVTASGSAAGATGTVPGIGTVAALGAVGAESLLFLEVASLYTMAVAATHGIDPASIDQRETLVMTVLLGSSGTALLAGALGTKGGASAAGGSLAKGALRLPSVRDINSKLAARFLRKFASKRVVLAFGKLAPAGIGAAIGGWGNRKLGKAMIETAHATFGTPPTSWSPA